MSKLRVAVIFGGMSGEHDISLRSATSVLKNISKNEFEVVCIGITKKGHWLFYPGDISLIETGEWQYHPDCTPAIISPDRLQSGIIKFMPDGETSILKIDCIFPVLHGKYYEDGCIQGLFELSGIPYAGSNTYSSSICMDKITTHIILDKHGIKTAKWNYIKYDSFKKIDKICEIINNDFSMPLFVKPCSEGSSLGVSKVNNIKELKSAIKIAFTHDKKVLIEEFIDGLEVECAVLGNNNPIASTVGSIIPSNEFYDYESKYISNDSKLNIPANLDQKIIDKIRETAIKVYKILDCSGLSRIDFFVKKNNEIILNEVNTLPGFTSISMYPKLFEYSDISYSNLITKLINLAIERLDT